jgi:hypothetical protein
VGFALRFRPTYATANVGHPSYPRRLSRGGKFCRVGLYVVFGTEEVDKQGHHEEDGDDGGQHASYDDAG